jgi:hypothetical protein
MPRVVSTLSLLAALLLAPLALSPAAADPPDSGGSSPAAWHCVHNLSDGVEQCFATFTEAIAVATGGAVTDAPADSTTAAADPAFAQRMSASSAATAAAAVLGISYVNSYYGGSSKVWQGSYGCDSSLDVDWQVANVGSTWNDRISSAQSYSSCQSKYWEHAYYAGASTSWFISAGSFGTMNDRATSIQFR